MRINKKKLFFGALAIASAFYAKAAFSGSVTCDGGTASTKPMPVSGPNFSSYCMPCIVALRTYARDPVIDTVVAAYGDLAKSHPETKFIYSEMGFPNGGRFRPHRTHREGLSVDLMVPLKNGRVVTANFTNRYGYDVEFSNTGTGADGEIDFSALAALVRAMEAQAKTRGGKVRRVILAPDLQPLLSSADSTIRSLVPFNRKQAWVRHDEHIHVDFSFPCPKP